MLLERMSGAVTLVTADGTEAEVGRVLWHVADQSDQTVMDVQTRFVNQARYKGDSETLTVLWPRDAPHDLMGAHLVIRGSRYRVYANPAPASGSPALVGYDTLITASRSLFLHEAELLAPARTRDQWGAWHTEWVPTRTAANLLRLSEDHEHADARHGMEGVALLELPDGAWREGYEAFRFGGDVYRITSRDEAGEQVVLVGTREVPGAHDDV